MTAHTGWIDYYRRSQANIAARAAAKAGVRRCAEPGCTEPAVERIGPVGKTPSLCAMHREAHEREHEANYWARRRAAERCAKAAGRGKGKRCCRCLKVKPLTAFGIKTESADGLQSACTDCKKAAAAAARNRERTRLGRGPKPSPVERRSRQSLPSAAERRAAAKAKVRAMRAAAALEQMAERSAEA